MFSSSHNSKDKPAVRELKRLLSPNGLAVWLDENKLQPGIPWQPVGLMALLTLLDAELAYGLHPLLDRAVSRCWKASASASSAAMNR